MHSLLRLPYGALVAGVSVTAQLPIVGDGKVARSLRARRGIVERFEAWAAAHRDTARPLLWVHAPSVGEGLQARPVIERLREKLPTLQIVYTYFSPSAERFAAALGVDFADYLPFDSAASAARLIDALKPTALVFSKLDLWPSLTEMAAARGVRLGMISATMSAESGRRGWLARALSRDAFAALEAVGAIDDADAERLVDAGVRREMIQVTGDTRYDQVAARAASVNRNAPPLSTLKADRPTLVAGSTWPADESRLLLAWLKTFDEVPSARLIIAPHEPTSKHLEPIRDWAALSGLSLSTVDHAEAGTTDVVLVDRVGVLGDLYAIADAAFVGGGFHPAGLHSVLEPAAFGVPVIFGPRHANSRDSRLLIEARGGASVRDERSLAEALRILLGEPDTRARAGKAARALVEAGRGAAAASSDLVERLLGAR